MHIKLPIQRKCSYQPSFISTANSLLVLYLLLCNVITNELGHQPPIVQSSLTQSIKRNIFRILKRFRILSVSQVSFADKIFSFKCTYKRSNKACFLPASIKRKTNIGSLTSRLYRLYSMMTLVCFAEVHKSICQIFQEKSSDK